MSEPTTSIVRRGAAAVVTIERPARSNALSRDTVLALGEAARALAADADVRAVVLTGRGDKAFCAGADLKERREMSEDQVRAMLASYRTELGALARCPKPVVAAINGVALGGGLELALHCDLRVAKPSATFALPETGLGIIPAAGGTQLLSRIVGEGRAKELVLLGRSIDSATALAWGLVNRVSPEGADVVEDALAFVEAIASGAPIAQAAALEAIDASFDLPLEEGLARELELYERCLTSADRQEALAAFAEKRPPRFRGE